MSDLKLISEAAGLRLDKFLTERCTGVSRSQLQKLIEQDRVSVNGKVARSGLKLGLGDAVVVVLPEPEPDEPAAENIPLHVVYEDEYLLVIDKPAGLVVHPAPGHTRHTLVNALLQHCPDLAGSFGKERPGIVHRLDKDTSGLLIVAKTVDIQEKLIRQFSTRTVHKTYVALVEGLVAQKQGLIEGPIGRDPDDRKLMAIVEGGREATTRYRVVEFFGSHTLIEAMPETGRTHQIRVHLAAIGYPVCGDRIYGRKEPHIRRQFLHAARISFQHPATDEQLDFSSPLPPDLEQALLQLR